MEKEEADIGIWMSFSRSWAMPGSREGNKTGEGLQYKNKRKRHEFSKMQVDKERTYGGK